MNKSPAQNLDKILVIVGPTATGKSDIAVKIAQEFNGEIISADSRQVYRGLDIGSGKITHAEMQGVTHHLLDIADPAERYTVAKWKKQAELAIADILGRGKLPIVIGGTGFYISSLLDGREYPEVDVDPAEQTVLEAQSVEELFSQLKSLDPDRALTIDPENKRRLSRAIIIARKLGKVPPLQSVPSTYDALLVGISLPDEELRDRIKTRLVQRLDAGMIEEVEKLHAGGLSYERLDELGLEYRYVGEFIQGTIKTREELIDTLATRIWQYSRRQKTWWRKDARIQWFGPSQSHEIAILVKNHLA